MWFQRDSNPWPLRCQCIALPTQLWRHSVGIRSICWAHLFPWRTPQWMNVQLSTWITSLIRLLHRLQIYIYRVLYDKLTSSQLSGFIVQLVEHCTGIAEGHGLKSPKFFRCLQETIGNLRNDDADGKDDATKQWLCTLCTCVLHFGTFLCRHLLNDDVKWLNSRFCGGR